MLVDQCRCVLEVYRKAARKVSMITASSRKPVQGLNVKIFDKLAKAVTARTMNSGHSTLLVV